MKNLVAKLTKIVAVVTAIKALIEVFSPSKESNKKKSA